MNTRLPFTFECTLFLSGLQECGADALHGLGPAAEDLQHVVVLRRVLVQGLHLHAAHAEGEGLQVELDAGRRAVRGEVLPPDELIHRGALGGVRRMFINDFKMPAGRDREQRRDAQQF